MERNGECAFWYVDTLGGLKWFEVRNGSNPCSILIQSVQFGQLHSCQQLVAATVVAEVNHLLHQASCNAASYGNETPRASSTRAVQRSCPIAG
jgi:hypothetical protein